MPNNSGIKTNQSGLQNLQHTLKTLFPTIDPTFLQEISAKMEWVKVDAGDALFHQGEEGNSLFVLMSGRLHAIVHEDSPQENIVGEIIKGESVGEMSLITGESRTATVRAVRDSLLAKLDKADFERVITAHPQVLMGISKQVIQRLTTSIHQLRKKKSLTTVAIFPIGDQSFTKFTRDFQNAIQPFMHSLYLDEPTVNQQFQGADKNDTALINWMAEMELQYDVVIYQTDGKDNDWTRRCIRQADKVLVVADATDTPGITEAEQQLLYNNPTVASELVMVHSPDTILPKGTRQFLENRKVKRHYHIKRGDPQHLQRLGRLLTGNANALVLSGGGAKGFAHIGIYRALVEANIPVDIVAGTSIGSIMAATIALGWPPGEVYENCRNAFLKDKPLKDYTLPLISLLKGRKLQKVTAKYFRDIQIEDLWLNFICVSSNFSTSRPQLHQRGPLYKAVSASASIPGVLPPVVEGDHLLIDGGVFNNFPVDITRQLYNCNVIGVDLNEEKQYKLNYDQIPGGWNYLMRNFLPFGKRYKIPSIATIMMKSTLLGSKQRQVQMKEEVDLYLKPPVGKYKLLDMKAFDPLVKSGYAYAREILKEEEIKNKVWCD